MNGPCGQDKVPGCDTQSQGLVTPVESGHSQRPKQGCPRLLQLVRVRRSGAVETGRIGRSWDSRCKRLF